MNKLITLCVTALMTITLSAQDSMTLSQGDMVAGFTYNSAYENESLTGSESDLAITIGYGISDNLAIMLTRDENNTGNDDAAINLGVRYFYNGFYGQYNMNDVQDATVDAQGNSVEEDATISVGKMFSLDWIDGLYADPSITFTKDEQNNRDTSFGMTLGMRF